MKHVFTFVLFLGLGPVMAQSVTGLMPGRNAHISPRTTNVEATLSGPAAPGNVPALNVFSTRLGGSKAGTTTVTGNVVSFNPTADFAPGETIMATLTSGAGPRQVWQFTTAVTGGTGTFGGGSDVPSGANPFALETGDLDGDGDLDFVTGNKAVGTGFNGLLVRLNDGAGHFMPGATVPLNDGSSAVKLGDVDSDGDLDLLSTVYNKVEVVLNNGSGVFSAATVWSIGQAGNSYAGYEMALGDVDGDGDLDFVVPSLGTSSDVVTVGFNDGAGRFAMSTTVVAVAFSNATSIALGDTNLDGALDLLVGKRLLRNDGTGHFTLTQTLNTGSFDEPTTVEFADLNGDGALDILLSDGVNIGPFFATVCLNNGAGVFSVGSRFSITGSAFCLGDLDADGALDFVVAGKAAIGPVLPVLNVWKNNGYGAFSNSAQGTLPASGIDVALGDLDADGDLDVLAATRPSGFVPFGSIDVVAVRMNGLSSTVTAQRPETMVTVATWPNPVREADVLHVDFSANVRATYTLCNALGQRVRMGAFKGKADIACNGLAPGMYVLILQADESVAIVRRVAVE